MANKILDYDGSLLTKLVMLKAVMLIAATALLSVAFLYFELEFSYEALVYTLLGGAAILLIWCLRLRLRFPVTEVELFLLLLSDVIVILFLIQFSGGSANPFTSSLLVPLALSAALLRKVYSLNIVVLTVVMYAFWTFGDSGEVHHMDHSNFSLHLYGMWINFFLSAIILFVFVAYAMDSVRKRESELQDAREKILRDEQLVAIATVTATTAHALGTPMSTMAILLEEWETDGNLNAEERKTFREQLDVCKKHLATIGNARAEADSAEPKPSSVVAFFMSLKEHFHLLQPVHTPGFALDKQLQQRSIFQSRALLLAVANLIENSIQAGATHVAVKFNCGHENLVIDISDDGEGLSQDIKAKLGQPFISSKQQGWGLGFYLSNSTVEQFGGKISIQNRESVGTLTSVFLPLVDQVKCRDE